MALWVRLIVIVRHKKKVEPPSYLILSVGLGLPCNTDKENEQAPLGCISCVRNTNQEERPSHYSDITSACEPTVKCPSSRCQNKRNALSQYVTIPFGTAPQRYKLLE